MSDTATVINVPASPATDPKNRIESIDVLRGVAVLGILTINIWFFAFPFDVASNPTLLPEYFGADVTAWWGSWVVLEGSQRAIFTMLFGASVYLFISRLMSDERRTQTARIYYRRTFLLIGFGLFNGYILLWEGDILFFYGVMGLLLYFMRNWKIRNLFIVAVILIVLLNGLKHSSLWLQQTYGEQAELAQEKLDRGESITQEEQIAIDIAASSSAFEPMSREDRIVQKWDRSDGYPSAFFSVAESTSTNYLQAGLYSLFWESLAYMMIGMAFFRLKLFDASRSSKLYLCMVVFGFGIGLVVNTLEMFYVVNNDYWSPFILGTYDIGRFAMAMGYTGLIMLICKLGWLPAVRSRLAAVGKMALTNYLMQSIFCLYIFVVIGLYGELRFHQIYYVVFAIWVVQLIYSPIWLKHFRYGPFEWLWRKLTYGQPIAQRLQAK